MSRGNAFSILAGLATAAKTAEPTLKRLIYNHGVIHKRLLVVKLKRVKLCGHKSLKTG